MRDSHRNCRTPTANSVLRRACSLWLLLAMAAGPVVAQRAAWADDATDRATAKTIMAQSLYKSGQFAKAAAMYLDAYAIAPRASLLFNAARAYEEAAMADEAIALFERYRTLKDADTEGKKDAAKRLEALHTKRAFPAKGGDVENARGITPAPLPAGGGGAGAPADAALATEEFPKGNNDGRRDAEAETSTGTWFLLGCLVIGLPIAYVSTPTVPPSRLMGRTPDYATGYALGFRDTAAGKQRSAALYGCLTGAAIAVIGAVFR